MPAADEPDPQAFLGEAGFLDSLEVLEDVAGLETSAEVSVAEVLRRFGNYDLVHFNQDFITTAREHRSGNAGKA